MKDEYQSFCMELLIHKTVAIFVRRDGIFFQLFKLKFSENKSFYKFSNISNISKMSNLLVI